MNDDIGKVAGWVNHLKAFLSEQLWLILLLTPLIVTALFVSEHFSSNKKQSSHAKTAVSVIAAVSPEVSSVQLAAIVAKPLGDLLKMDVYFDRQSNARNTGNLISSAEFNHTSNAFDQSIETFKAYQFLRISKNISREIDG